MSTQLTAAEGFRYGVLLRCAEERLDEAATQDRITKIAGMCKVASVPAIAASGLGALKSLGWLGILGSMGVGAGGGYGLAKLQEGDVDADDYRKQDLMAAYAAATQQMRERAARMKTFRQAPRTPRLL